MIHILQKEIMKNVLFIVMAIFLGGCATYPTKAPLRNVMKQHDPALLALKPGYNDYVHRTHLKDGTEVGTIQVQDGTASQYWFRSHHRTEDIGGTWFKMSDGATLYMAGYFCCEAQFPEKQIESQNDLKAFINEHHGTKP